MKKIILSLILTLSIALTLYPMPVSAKSYASGEDIEEELKNVDLTPYVEANKTDIITLSEVGFGTEDYKLIVYVYNATGKAFYKGTTESNVINIATNHDENFNITYNSNFCLKYISSTKDDKIYKFSVIDGGVLSAYAMKMQNNYNKRRYDIVGIQLININENLAVDNKINKTYEYRGTSKDNSLSVDGFKVIELEVTPFYYRPDDDLDLNQGYQLNSIYFSVPDIYREDNYRLTSVNLQWYEYKTEPIMVIQDKDLYEELKPYVGKVISNYDENLPFLCAGHFPFDVLDQNGMPTGVTLHSFKWTFNQYKNTWFDVYKPDETTNRITLLFDDSDKEGVTLKETEDALFNYTASSVNGYLPIGSGKVSADLFQDSVDSGRIKGYNNYTVKLDDGFNLKGYKESVDFFDRFLEYNAWDAFWGNVPNPESEKIAAIYEVQENDIKLGGLMRDETYISNKLYMGEQYVEDFANFYNDSIKREQTPYIIRFSNTEYKSYCIKRFGEDAKLGYVGSETCFFDLDVINLQFFNGYETLVVPVVSSSVHLIPNPTPPIIITFDDKNWIWWLIGAIAVSVLITILISSVIKENR